MSASCIIYLCTSTVGLKIYQWIVSQKSLKIQHLKTVPTIPTYLEKASSAKIKYTLAVMKFLVF